MKQLVKLLVFLDVAARKTFQVGLSLLAAMLFALAFYGLLVSLIDPLSACHYKSDDPNILLDDIHSFLLSVIWGSWTYALYKSYRKPFTWKKIFIHLLIFVCLSYALTWGAHTLHASRLYRSGAVTCIF